LLGSLGDAGQWDMDHRTPLLAAAVIVPSLVGSILNWSRWILDEGEVDRDGRAAKSAGES
jgi:hypothetical protein